ncbi:hypothetical protein [Clostridium tagluense]|uniref:hypothetical protein n=1 Tax=Clostridium tagluense TaxID=360422 RepID=UPI001C6EC720|nr:hypothetical protein [Clostridium tagluense]MBW9154886.1 hypothetical protein [Clostridium tagluense]WLC64341.1 hypothetical protein KTC93_15885 [Clostridium tagluense]
MSTKGAKTPGVKNCTLNIIVSGLMFHQEALKREKDINKREFHQKRLNELKLELGNYKAV